MPRGPAWCHGPVSGPGTRLVPVSAG
jgi:hypothetical protein